jgi:hypothetical protein
MALLENRHWDFRAPVETNAAGTLYFEPGGAVLSTSKH